MSSVTGGNPISTTTRRPTNRSARVEERSQLRTPEGHRHRSPARHPREWLRTLHPPRRGYPGPRQEPRLRFIPWMAKACRSLGGPEIPVPKHPIDDHLGPGQLPGEAGHIPLEIRILEGPDSPSVEESLILVPFPYQDGRDRAPPGRQVPQKDQGVPTVVSGSHQSRDLPPGKELLENQGGRSARIFHEGGLGNSQLLNGDIGRTRQLSAPVGAPTRARPKGRMGRSKTYSSGSPGVEGGWVNQILNGPGRSPEESAGPARGTTCSSGRWSGRT